MLRMSLFGPLLLLTAAACDDGYAQDGTDVHRRSGRAFLGVHVVPHDSELGIVAVLAGSPADGAGLKKGDRILSVNGAAVGDPAGFVRLVREKKPGDQMTIEIRRDGQRRTIDVVLGTREPFSPRLSEPGGTAGHAFLGVGYAEVPIALAAHLRLDPGVGVLVADVKPGSAADKAGVVTHDVIVKVGREVVKGRKGLVDVIGRRSPGDEVTLDMIHRGEPVTRTALLGERTMPLTPLRPRGLWRGRLRIGDEFDLVIPWELDRPNGLPDELRRHLEEGELDDRIRKHIEEAFKDFESKSLSSSRSVARFVEGDLDITVTTDGDQRRITVKKGGKAIAEDLPFEKLDSLPEDVRESVRDLIRKYDIDPGESDERVEGIEGFKI